MIVLVTFLVLLVAIGLLALRYGVDSRETTRSPAEEFTSFGISWNAQDRL